ncbi:hypothetical protein M9H77_18131 [Catharanthus roseus]|uniref:Uncharacterized protein n=1 Tax=Catharanthus roseus TaxID=4058 RepID=A0ACC0B6M4_CATRO|nr:hypothetical protein M9H77_18131 [Catharanthus roseus]
MKLKLGPTTRARIKKLKASNGKEDKGMNLNYKQKWIYIKVTLEKPPIEFQFVFIMSTEGQLPIQSHEEGTSYPTRMNLNETLSSKMEYLSIVSSLLFIGISHMS